MVVVDNRVPYEVPVPASVDRLSFADLYAEVRRNRPSFSSLMANIEAWHRNGDKAVLSSRLLDTFAKLTASYNVKRPNPKS